MTPSHHSFSSTPANIRKPLAIAPSLEHRPFSDPNHLAPEDAFLAHSPPRRQRDRAVNGSIDGSIANGDLAVARSGGVPRTKPEKERGRSGSRKNKLGWKKLLWVKHPGCMSYYLNREHGSSHAQVHSRSRQLHRPANLPFSSAAKSTSLAIRLLASGSRYYRENPTPMNRRHIYMLFCGYRPGASLGRVCGELGQRVYGIRLGPLGFLGRPGRSRYKAGEHGSLQQQQQQQRRRRSGRRWK